MGTSSQPARTSSPAPKPAKVLLKVTSPSLRQPVVELLDALGYSFVEETRPGGDAQGQDLASSQVDLILIVVDADHPHPVPRAGKPSESAGPPPPSVVFGPDEGNWRKQALDAGAFACLSLSAPFEERAGLLAAAARYQAAQREVLMLRKESERICTGLLQSFGHEAEKLQKTIREVQKIQESLEQMQVRIIKSIS